MSALDEFVNQVNELAKAVLIDSKSLAEVVNADDAEEKFPGLARDAATATSRLIDVVNVANLDNAAQQEELLQATREARDCLLELCRATKAAITNPYDFLTSQKLQNCRKGIAIAIKVVLEIAESLRQADTIEDAKVAVQAIGKMVVAARGQNQDEFIETAKAAAASMSKLIEVARNKNLQQETLFDSTQRIITAAKAAFRDASPASLDALDAAMKHVAEEIKNFVTALQNAPLSPGPEPKQPVLAMSRRATTSPTTSHPTISVTGTGSSAAGTVQHSSSNDDFPPPVSQPLVARLPSGERPVRRQSQNPSPRASPTTATLTAHAPPLDTRSSTAGNLPVVAPTTIARLPVEAVRQAPVSTAPAGQTFAFLIDLLHILIRENNSFNYDWGQSTSAQQEALIKKLEAVAYDPTLVPLKEKLLLLRAGVKAASEESLKNRELDSLKSLNDFADWRSRTMNLSIRKRLGNLLASFTPEQEPPSRDHVVPQLVEFQTPIIEAMTDFVCRCFLRANEGTVAELEDTVKIIHDMFKRVILLAKAALQPSQAAFEKVLSSVQGFIDTSPLRGVQDQGVNEVATTLLSSLVTASLQKRLYRETNNVRVLAIHLLATINSAAVSKANLHHSVAIQLGFICRAITESMLRALHTATTVHFMEQQNQSRDNSALELGNVVEPAVLETESNSKPRKEKDAKIKQLLGEDLEKGPTEKSIWEEGEVPIKELQKGFSAASLNKLVLAISAESGYDNKTLRTFITTYRSFAAPHKLFQKLLERYNVPKNAPVDKKRTQLRVTVIVKYWVENQFFDFDDLLVQRLTDWICVTLPDDGFGDVSKMLKAQLDKQLQQRNQQTPNDPPTDFAIPDSKLSPSDLFIALNDEEIARQLSLIEFKIYSKIEPSELLNQSWNKDKLKYRAINVTEALARLNRLSFWVPSMIMWQEKMKERSKLYAKFVNIAEHLRKMNNYHTLMGIVAGMNMSSVNRLKHTLADVGQAVQNRFKLLVKLMHPSGNFKAYRDALHKSKAPAIPYLGTFLTDLTFIEDGNPDLIDGNINWKKREMVFQVIQEVQLFQNTPYNFPSVEPIATFLTDLPFASEKELFDLSLQREPRDAELSQIVQ